MRTGEPVAQNNLRHAEAVNHRYCNLIAAIAAIAQRGTGEIERKFRGHRFIGDERVLRAYGRGEYQSSRDCGWDDMSYHEITQ